MQFGRARAARGARHLAVAAVLACAVLAATASSALAWSDGDRDSYTVNVSPATAPAGQSTTFDVALTNTSSPGSGLSSALLSPPLGFRVTGASLPPGAGGHAYVVFGVVVLDRLNLAPGSTVHVSVTATAPARCGTPARSWFTWANEGGWFGDDMRLDPGSNVMTSVPCVTATALKFATQPNDAVVGSVITGNADDTSGPAVTVDIVDASGNVVDSSAPVTIALGSNPPGNANLGGTTTQNAVHGVATFSNLTLDQAANGYTLAASSSGLTSATSSSFNENDSATPCPSGATCTHTITSNSGSLQVDVGSGTTDATLTESVDVGTPMDGPGSNPNADPGCANYTPPAASADWYEFVVRPADGTTYDRTKTITWTVNGTSADGFKVCFGAPYEFLTPNSDGRPVNAPAGALPDGTQGFVGLLAPCSNLTAGSPCVSSLNTVTDPTTGGQSAVAVVDIPAGLQGDPWMAR